MAFSVEGVAASMETYSCVTGSRALIHSGNCALVTLRAMVRGVGGVVDG